MSSSLSGFNKQFKKNKSHKIQPLVISSTGEKTKADERVIGAVKPGLKADSQNLSSLSRQSPSIPIPKMNLAVDSKIRGRGAIVMGQSSQTEAKSITLPIGKQNSIIPLSDDHGVAIEASPAETVDLEHDKMDIVENADQSSTKMDILQENVSHIPQQGAKIPDSDLTDETSDIVPEKLQDNGTDSPSGAESEVQTNADTNESMVPASASPSPSTPQLPDNKDLVVELQGDNASSAQDSVSENPLATPDSAALGAKMGNEMEVDQCIDTQTEPEETESSNRGVSELSTQEVPEVSKTSSAMEIESTGAYNSKEEEEASERVEAEEESKDALSDEVSSSADPPASAGAPARGDKPKAAKGDKLEPVFLHILSQPTMPSFEPGEQLISIVSSVPENDDNPWDSDDGKRKRRSEVGERSRISTRRSDRNGPEHFVLRVGTPNAPLKGILKPARVLPPETNDDVPPSKPSESAPSALESSETTDETANMTVQKQDVTSPTTPPPASMEAADLLKYGIGTLASRRAPRFNPSRSSSAQLTPTKLKKVAASAPKPSVRFGAVHLGFASDLASKSADNFELRQRERFQGNEARFNELFSQLAESSESELPSLSSTTSSLASIMNTTLESEAASSQGPWLSRSQSLPLESSPSQVPKLREDAVRKRNTLLSELTMLRPTSFSLEHVSDHDASHLISNGKISKRPVNARSGNRGTEEEREESAKARWRFSVGPYWKPSSIEQARIDRAHKVIRLRQEMGHPPVRTLFDVRREAAEAKAKAKADARSEALSQRRERNSKRKASTVKSKPAPKAQTAKHNLSEQVEEDYEVETDDDSDYLEQPTTLATPLRVLLSKDFEEDDDPDDEDYALGPKNAKLSSGSRQPSGTSKRTVPPRGTSSSQRVSNPIVKKSASHRHRLSPTLQSEISSTTPSIEDEIPAKLEQTASSPSDGPLVVETTDHSEIVPSPPAAAENASSTPQDAISNQVESGEGMLSDSATNEVSCPISSSTEPSLVPSNSVDKGTSPMSQPLDSKSSEPIGNEMDISGSPAPSSETAAVTASSSSEFVAGTTNADPTSQEEVTQPSSPSQTSPSTMDTSVPEIVSNEEATSKTDAGCLETQSVRTPASKTESKRKTPGRKTTRGEQEKDTDDAFSGSESDFSLALGPPARKLLRPRLVMSEPPKGGHFDKGAPESATDEDYTPQGSQPKKTKVPAKKSTRSKPTASPSASEPSLDIPETPLPPNSQVEMEAASQDPELLSPRKRKTRFPVPEPAKVEPTSKSKEKGNASKTKKQTTRSTQKNTRSASASQPPPGSPIVVKKPVSPVALSLTKSSKANQSKEAENSTSSNMDIDDAHTDIPPSVPVGKRSAKSASMAKASPTKKTPKTPKKTKDGEVIIIDDSDPIINADSNDENKKEEEETSKAEKELSSKMDPSSPQPDLSETQLESSAMEASIGVSGANASDSTTKETDGVLGTGKASESTNQSHAVPATKNPVDSETVMLESQKPSSQTLPIPETASQLTPTPNLTSPASATPATPASLADQIDLITSQCLLTQRHLSKIYQCFQIVSMSMLFCHDNMNHVLQSSCEPTSIVQRVPKMTSEPSLITLNQAAVLRSSPAAAIPDSPYSNHPRSKKRARTSESQQSSLADSTEQIEPTMPIPDIPATLPLPQSPPAKRPANHLALSPPGNHAPALPRQMFSQSPIAPVPPHVPTIPIFSPIKFHPEILAHSTPVKPGTYQRLLYSGAGDAPPSPPQTRQHLYGFSSPMASQGGTQAWSPQNSQGWISSQLSQTQVVPTQLKHPHSVTSSQEEPFGPMSSTQGDEGIPATLPVPAHTGPFGQLSVPSNDPNYSHLASRIGSLTVEIESESKHLTRILDTLSHWAKDFPILDQVEFPKDTIMHRVSLLIQGVSQLKAPLAQTVSTPSSSNLASYITLLQYLQKELAENLRIVKKLLSGMAGALVESGNSLNQLLTDLDP